MTVNTFRSVDIEIQELYEPWRSKALSGSYRNYDDRDPRCFPGYFVVEVDGDEQLFEQREMGPEVFAVDVATSECTIDA
jgi:hypothetical protein